MILTLMDSVKTRVFADRNLTKNFFSMPEPDNTLSGIYATWYDDPRNTIMIHVQTKDSNEQQLQYKPESVEHWSTAQPEKITTYEETDRYTHWYKLIGLSPNSRYNVKFQDEETSFSTMPETLSRDVRLVYTGDTTHNQEVMKNNLALGAIKTFDPDCIVMAGDICHADNNHSKWESFFDVWFSGENKKNNGDLIPFVVTLGNHDGRRESVSNPGTYHQLWNSLAEHAYQFFSYFSLPESGYDCIDVGNYMSLVLLDSGHINTVESQNTWLDTTLSDRADVPWLLPSFHVSPYPGGYDYNAGVQPSIRDNWTELFTIHGVKVVNTSHNHVFAVSPPMTKDIIDPDGAIYTGQGASFGTWFRDLLYTDQEIWIEASKGAGDVQTRGFCGVTIESPTKLKLERITVNSEVINTIEITQ